MNYTSSGNSMVRSELSLFLLMILLLLTAGETEANEAPTASIDSVFPDLIYQNQSVGWNIMGPDTVGYWPLDNGTGITAYDHSGNENHGILYSEPIWVDGINGKALEFDGSDDYVKMTGVAVNTAAGAKNTVDFWMYWDGTYNTMPFAWDVSYNVYFGASCFGFNTGQSDVLGFSPSGLENRWVHVSAVFYNGVPNAAHNELYINGEEQSLSACTGNSGASRTVTSTAYISGWEENENYKFSGIIDEVRIHNSAVNITELHPFSNMTLLHGTGTDSDGMVANYTWSSSKDGVLSHNRNDTIYATNLSPGNHTISFKVQDNNGTWSDEDTIYLTVKSFPTANVVVISSNPAHEGTQVNFTGSGTDTDGDIIGYQWRSSLDGNLSSDASFSNSSLSYGNHSIYFRVQDNESLWSEEVLAYLYVNAKPVADIDFILPFEVYNSPWTSDSNEWQYVRPLTINPATPVDDYQVRLTLNSSNFDYDNANSTGADVRFYDSSQSKLEYWIETWNTDGNSTIWVNVEKAGTVTMYLYYGNSFAEDESNISIFSSYSETIVRQGNNPGTKYLNFPTTDDVRVLQYESSLSGWMFGDFDQSDEHITVYHNGIFHTTSNTGNRDCYWQSTPGYPNSYTRLDIGDGSLELKVVIQGASYNWCTYDWNIKFQLDGYARKYVSSEPVTTVGSETDIFAGIVIFNGTAYDFDDDIINVTWSSSIDGLLSTDRNFSFLSSNLSVGNHEITFKAQSSNGAWSESATSSLIVKMAPKWSYTTGDLVASVIISADGEYIAAGSRDDKVYLFDKDSNTPLWSYSTGANVNTVAISADGEYIVAGSVDKKVYLFDKDGDTPIWSYETGENVNSVAISADGEYIVAGSNDYYVYFFDKDSNTPLWSYATGSNVWSVAISVDGEYIVAGSQDNNVYLFDKNSNTPLWSYDAECVMGTVSISADGEYITAGCTANDNKIYLFDKDSSTPLWTYTAGSSVLSVAISADGEYITAASYDAKVYLFDKDSNTPLWSYDTGDTVLSVAISSDGEYIVAGTGGTTCGNCYKTVYLFERDSSTPLWNYATGANLWSVDISAGGEYITAGCEYANVYLFENINRPEATIESITPSSSITGDEVVFSGTGFDQDGFIEAYEWFSDIDGLLSMEADFSISNLSAGTHTITFRVQDDNMAWSEWDTAMLVVIPNAPPVATIDIISPSPARFDEEVTFSSTGSDSDGTVVAYEWQSSLHEQITFLSDEPDFSVTGLSVGDYTIMFRVQDNKGLWSSWVYSQLTVVANAPPVASIESFVPSSPVEEFDEVKFNGAVFDSDGTIVSYQWNSSKKGFMSNQQVFSTSNLSAGTHIISFRALDNDGSWSDWDTATLVVNPNSPPVATIDSIEIWKLMELNWEVRKPLLCNNPCTMEGKATNFNGSGSDSDGTVMAYEWTSSADGELSTDQDFVVSYLSVGAHNIAFRVQDNDGVWSAYDTILLFVYSDSDGDGIRNDDDAFPDDPAASIDSDGDGYPNEWNTGKSKTDSSTFLQLDAFPSDYHEWSDTDGDGIGDNSDIFVSIPTHFVYVAGAFTLIVLSAVGLELRTRSGIPSVLEGLENLVSEGMERDAIAVAIENLKGMENFQGIGLLSSDLSDAKSVLSEGLATQQRMIDTMTDLANFREELSAMQQEGMEVGDMLASINELELQLAQQASLDSSVKYLETLQNKFVEGQEIDK